VILAKLILILRDGIQLIIKLDMSGTKSNKKDKKQMALTRIVKLNLPPDNAR